MTRELRFKLNLSLIILAAILIVAFFVFSDTLNFFAKAENFLPAREIEIVGNEPEPKVIEIKPFDHILEKIEFGKEMLFESKPLEIVDYGQKRKEISLAILDTKNGDVFEKRYWLYQNDIDKSNHKRPEVCGLNDHYPNLEPVRNDPSFMVVVNWWNSHNSNLSFIKNDCSELERYVVIANKILIPNQYLAYPQDRTGDKYSEIIYTPYSESLHREELIKEGLDYLNKQVDLAFKHLEALKIQSRAYSGKLVTETMSQEFVKHIFIDEQSDPKAMLLSPDSGKRVAERALIRLGANKDKAFRYTYSSAGALGLAQIIPSTYQSIVREYPEALLIKDINIGRAEVLNSIKASILVHDDHFATVVRRSNQSSRGKELLGQKNETEIEEIKAAIYNGGPGKYLWQTGTISLAIPETVSYLLKLEFIRQLNLFE